MGYFCTLFCFHYPVAQVFNLCLHRRDACAIRLFLILREIRGPMSAFP
jgi:hypothetical protein